jgi:hypothetical protein
MIKTFVRAAIVFTLLFVSNSLAGSQTVGFDGGGPTPQCSPNNGCLPPASSGK